MVQYAHMTEDTNSVEIRRHLSVPIAEVPVSVDPSLCLLEQSEMYYKSGFVLSLIRRWTSLDSVELDTLMNEKSPN